MLFQLFGDSLADNLNMCLGLFSGQNINTIIILGECRALWGERSEAWYRVTAAADAEAATYVK